MGYRHPYATVATPMAEIKPGINDLLLLNLIYNGKYPTYKENSKNEPLPKNASVLKSLPGFTFFKVKHKV